MDWTFLQAPQLPVLRLGSPARAVPFRDALREKPRELLRFRPDPGERVDPGVAAVLRRAWAIANWDADPDPRLEPIVFLALLEMWEQPPEVAKTASSRPVSAVERECVRAPATAQLPVSARKRKRARAPECLGFAKADLSLGARVARPPWGNVKVFVDKKAMKPKKPLKPGGYA